MGCLLACCVDEYIDRNLYRGGSGFTLCNSVVPSDMTDVTVIKIPFVLSVYNNYYVN